MYDTSESREWEVKRPRLLAAHAYVRLCNAQDYQSYFQQDLVDLYESNYRRATEMLHVAEPSSHPTAGPSQPVAEPSSHPTVGPSQPTFSNAVNDPAQLPIIGHEDDDDEAILSIIDRVLPVMSHKFSIIDCVHTSSTIDCVVETNQPTPFIPEVITNTTVIEPDVESNKVLAEESPSSAVAASKSEIKIPKATKKKNARKGKKKNQNQNNTKAQKKEIIEKNKNEIIEKYKNDEVHDVECVSSGDSSDPQIPAELAELQVNIPQRCDSLRAIKEEQEHWAEHAPDCSIQTASKVFKGNKEAWGRTKAKVEQFRNESAYQGAVALGLCLKERKELSALEQEIDVAMNETSTKVMKKIIEERVKPPTEPKVRYTTPGFNKLSKDVDDVIDVKELYLKTDNPSLVDGGDSGCDSTIEEEFPPPLEPIPFTFEDERPPPLEPIQFTELTETTLPTPGKSDGSKNSKIGSEESERPSVDYLVSVVELLITLTESLDEAQELELAIMMDSAQQPNLSKLSTKGFAVKRLQMILDDASDWEKTVKRNPTIPLENLAYVYLYTTFAYLLIRAINDDEFNKNLSDSFKLFPKFVGTAFRGESREYDTLPDHHVSFSKDKKAAERFGEFMIVQRFEENDEAFDLSSVGNPQTGEEEIICLTGCHEEDREAQNSCKDICQEETQNPRKDLYDVEGWSRCVEGLSKDVEAVRHHSSTQDDWIGIETTNLMDMTSDEAEADADVVNVSQPTKAGITITVEVAKSMVRTYQKVVNDTMVFVKGKFNLVVQLMTHLREPWPSVKIMRYLNWLLPDAIVHPMGDMALSKDLFNHEL